MCTQHVAWFPEAYVAVRWEQKVRVPVGLTVVLLALEAWVCSGKPGCHTLPVTVSLWWLPSSLGHTGLYTVWRNVLTADHSHLWDTLVCTRYDGMCWQQTTPISGTHWSVQGMTECADSRPVTSLGHTGLYTVWRNVLTADLSHLWEQAHLSIWTHLGGKRWTNTKSMASVQGYQHIIMKMHKFKQDMRCFGKKCSFAWM